MGDYDIPGQSSAPEAEASKIVADVAFAALAAVDREAAEAGITVRPLGVYSFSWEVGKEPIQDAVGRYRKLWGLPAKEKP